MKLALLILISFASVFARAKTFDLADLKGRHVITRADGTQYIQVKRGDDLYEEYRARVRAAISESGLGAQPGDDYNEQRALFQSSEEAVGVKKVFVGFELPSMTKIYGLPSRSVGLDPRASRGYRLMRSTPVVDSDSIHGAVFVPTCRNPQGPLDLEDPMNQRQLSCYPSILIFRKFGH